MPNLIIKKVNDNMKIWLTADPHFGHANIIKYCDRPFSNVYEMDKEIIRRHNEVVSPDDIVYMLGDVSFHNTEELLSRMNGIFLFIKGNHDHKTIKQKSLNHTVLEYGKVRMLLIHDPHKIYGRFTLNVCGHVHEKWRFNKIFNAFNVGVDVNNFYPVSFDFLVKFCENLT